MSLVIYYFCTITDVILSTSDTFLEVNANVKPCEWTDAFIRFWSTLNIHRLTTFEIDKLIYGRNIIT